MRRLSLTLLVVVAVLPATALAARVATGDGVFELRDANGTFVLSGRGVIWGQMDKGVMRVTALDPGQQLAVSGADKPPVKAADDPNTTIYQGTNLHFRASSGKYRIRFRGTSVDLTAIGIGNAFLSGSTSSLDPGDYALDGGKWLPIAWEDKSVPFGTQAPQPSPTS
jgi:hypothetical protein